MRRREALALAGALTLAPVLPAQADDRDGARLKLLSRIAFGPTPTDFERLSSAGEGAWLRGQLHPGDPELPPEVLTAISAYESGRRPLIEVLRELDAQNKAANGLLDPDQKKAAQGAYQGRLNSLSREAGDRFVLRALYSRNQLQEQMTWFWYNHFNVFAAKANIRAMVGDYEDRAIRPHALGRFRELVLATLRHPAMLRYLDNADNAAGRINENYARELMELHTLGVDGGYTQADVQDLARILTGVGIELREEPPRLRPELQALLVRDGAFLFNPQRHDFGDKTLLGRKISGRGFAEVEEAVDLLVRHPATASHISRKMAVFFVGEDPSEALVASLAGAFQRTNGDVPSVLSTLFASEEFRRSLGTKAKDPVRFVLSAVRLAYPDRSILNPQPVLGWMNRLGEPLYGRETPDGYALAASAWLGPGQLAGRFEVARQIGSGSSGLFRPDVPGAKDEPAYPEVKNALWYRALERSVSPGTKSALAGAASPQEWNTLYLSSPDFMSR